MLAFMWGRPAVVGTQIAAVGCVVGEGQIWGRLGPGSGEKADIASGISTAAGISGEALTAHYLQCMVHEPGCCPCMQIERRLRLLLAVHLGQGLQEGAVEVGVAGLPAPHRPAPARQACRRLMSWQQGWSSWRCKPLSRVSPPTKPQVRTAMLCMCVCLRWNALAIARCPIVACAHTCMCTHTPSPHHVCSCLLCSCTSQACWQTAAR